jgi:tetratricopeptide (TPR) repeat protein
MIAFALALLITMQPAQAAAQDQVKEALSRAESLYYEAKFNEAIQLLSQVNETLRTQPNRVKERVATKFQLALANMGLNNVAAAKSFLMEIYGLDPDFTVDAQQFSPKVVTLANDAKTEFAVARCKLAVDDAKKNLVSGDTAAVLTIIQTMKPKCSDLAALEPDTAELLFKKGLNDYKQGFLPGALQSFRSALILAPKHEMAAQYVELTENRLQVAGDRVMLDWQKNFQARQFRQAAAVYRQIASFNDPNNAQTLGMMGAEYRKALDPLVESFNKACASGDTTKGNEIRDQITDLIPEASFGADLRAKMVPCNPPPAPVATPVLPVVSTTTPPVTDTRVASRTEPKPSTPSAPKPDPKPGPTSPAKTPPASSNPARPCFQMDAALAMLRLKQRVEPTFTQQALAYLQNTQPTVVVKARIEDTGSVTVLDASGANILVNNAVRSAVEMWKFNPAMDENGPRCVDTEIPIGISRR